MRIKAYIVIKTPVITVALKEKLGIFVYINIFRNTKTKL